MRSNKEIITVLNNLRIEQHISVSELARKVDMAKSALSRYFNGTREFPLNKINIFAKALGVSPEYILGVEPQQQLPKTTQKILSLLNKLPDKEQEKILSIVQQRAKKYEIKKSNILRFNPHQKETGKKIIALGYASAGTGEFLIEDMKVEKEYYGSIPKYDYALVVNGDSMEPIFQDGQVIFVKKVYENSRLLDGQIVIAELNGCAYIKKLRLFANHAELISMNNKYDPIKVTKNDEFIIAGKVIL